MFSLHLSQAKIGDMSAFAALYDASYDRVYRYIFHRTLDTIATEDIISEVYMKVLKHIKKLRGDTEGEYYAWIFQIAYTSIVDHSRRDIGVDSLEDTLWEPRYEEDKGDLLDQKEKLDEVLAYLDTLSEKERSIITMRVWDDLDYATIATILEESEPNIRKIFSRTLAKIGANVSALSILFSIIHYVW